MAEVGNENVLKHVVESFAETIALKVRQLRRHIPKEKAKTNTDLTGAFIEELVRGFLRGWIGHKQMLHGTFYFQEHIDSGEKPLQIDGIVYDPTRGPPTLREGDFIVVHPAFCSGVIEIKMTVSSTHDFEKKLWRIHSKCNRHFGANYVMGVIVADANPTKASLCPKTDGTFIEYHDFSTILPRRELDVGTLDKDLLESYRTYTVPLCPIFVLFKETSDGEYEPFYPAIESMIRAIYTLILNYGSPGKHNLNLPVASPFS